MWVTYQTKRKIRIDAIEDSRDLDRMAVLWFALGLYVLGIAVVLYIRPRLMFQDDRGVWKEFGLGTSDRTLFPFWLFTIVWAISSYALASVLTTLFAKVALRSSSFSSSSFFPNTSSSFIPISQASPTVPSTPATSPAPSVMPSVNSGVPGYYVLDSVSSGTPKYLYFGTTPPHLSNLPRV
jgi:hypothetical protein